MDPKNMDFNSMMSSFMQNAQKMQDNLKHAYQEIAERHKDKTVEGKAGGGLVTVVANLKLQITKVVLKPELFVEYKDQPEVISELIAAATNQAVQSAQSQVKQEMLEVTKKMGLPTDLANMPFNPGAGG